MKTPLGWLAGFASASGPRYLRIVSALEAAVADGVLLPGERMPAQRTLADALGLDLTTVSRAYQECRKRGLVDTRGPQGTFVAPPKVEFDQIVDLSMNIPPAPAGINLMDLLRYGLSQVLVRSEAPRLMTYHLGGGSVADQEAGRRWLQQMLGPDFPGQVIACPGAQATLAALIMTLTAPGDAIGCEPLIYPGLLLATQTLGRRVVTIGTDADGMTPDGLEAAHREHGVRVVYLNPTAQNPTGHTIPLDRRNALAKVASGLDLIVLEDDPYWLLAEQAPPPLAAIAPGQTCYIATLSKCLSPGLRTAYLRLPPQVDPQAFLAALRSISLMSAPLLISMVTQWILDGTAQQLLQAVQKEARERRAIARHALSGLHEDPCDGVHLWHRLPPHWNADAFARAAQREGLTVAPSSAFALHGAAPYDAIRISLGAVTTRAELTSALRKLDRLIQQPPAESLRIMV
ncbi:PLP-dependent aminotransferase family protein [Pseudoxanthomonas sp.]|uniref:aminotransferase-like domain-containing protein n=1 Tax=Pseudoxanthomonas sp. TaxID=1871049 RepID=UPI002637A31C|nr:PLP-dependent aminotransferase family protein [Pseudoxanthomonas sp.]WDS34852.1 MAG: PLP-dependent aminotransferase family protein [Pseudoxanthomonas sp.]